MTHPPPVISSCPLSTISLMSTRMASLELDHHMARKEVSAQMNRRLEFCGGTGRHMMTGLMQFLPEKNS